jgi:type IV pilus assembly protein PilB
MEALVSTVGDRPELAVQRRRLGDVLLAAGMVNADELARALNEQTQTKHRLGEILTSGGLVRAYELAAALATLFDLDTVDLSVVVPDPKAVGLLPEALARRLNALPLTKDKGHVVVAIDDPSNLIVLDDVRAAIGSPVQFVVAPPEQLALAVEVAWQPKQGQDTTNKSRLVLTSGDFGLDLAAATANDAPVVRLVDQLLVRALHERASDMHVEAGANGALVRFRVDGMLHDVLTIAPSAARATVSRLKVLAGLDIAQHRLPQDGRMSFRAADNDVDVRIATLPTVHGEAVVLRILNKSAGVLDLDDLGFLPDTLAAFTAAYVRPYGGVLVTGPTGSGKTSTLYAALSRINVPERNIITVEDPVEYEIDGIKQVQVSEPAGLGFARILRAALRCDPDVILVGEIRDRETAHIVAEAAITGHLVLSTAHTNDAASTPTRLVEMGLEPFLVASSLNCILSQRLARRLCKRCRAPYAPTADELAAAGWDASGLPLPPRLYRAVGCPDCLGSGYQGRFAIHEVMTMTRGIKDLIMANAPAGQLYLHAVASGMRPMWVDGLHKAAAGQTSLEELARVVTSNADDDLTRERVSSVDLDAPTASPGGDLRP